VAPAASVEVASAVVGVELAGEALWAAASAPPVGRVEACLADDALSRGLVDGQACSARVALLSAAGTAETVRRARLAHAVEVCEEPGLAGWRAAACSSGDERREARGAGGRGVSTAAARGVAPEPDCGRCAEVVSEWCVGADERVRRCVEREQLARGALAAVLAVGALEARRLARQALEALDEVACSALRTARVHFRQVLAGDAGGAEVWPVELAGGAVVRARVARPVNREGEARSARAAGCVGLGEVRIDAVEGTGALGAAVCSPETRGAVRAAGRADACQWVCELALRTSRTRVRREDQRQSFEASSAAVG